MSDQCDPGGRGQDAGAGSAVPKHPLSKLQLRAAAAATALGVGMVTAVANRRPRAPPGYSVAAAAASAVLEDAREQGVAVGPAVKPLLAKRFPLLSVVGLQAASAARASGGDAGPGDTGDARRDNLYGGDDGGGGDDDGRYAAVEAQIVRDAAALARAQLRGTGKEHALLAGGVWCDEDGCTEPCAVLCACGGALSGRLLCVAHNRAIHTRRPCAARHTLLLWKGDAGRAVLKRLRHNEFLRAGCVPAPCQLAAGTDGVPGSATDGAASYGTADAGGPGGGVDAAAPSPPRSFGGVREEDIVFGLLAQPLSLLPSDGCPAGGCGSTHVDVHEIDDSAVRVVHLGFGGEHSAFKCGRVAKVRCVARRTPGGAVCGTVWAVGSGGPPQLGAAAPAAAGSVAGDDGAAGAAAGSGGAASAAATAALQPPPHPRVESVGGGAHADGDDDGDAVFADLPPSVLPLTRKRPQALVARSLLEQHNLFSSVGTHGQSTHEVHRLLSTGGLPPPRLAPLRSLVNQYRMFVNFPLAALRGLHMQCITCGAAVPRIGWDGNFALFRRRAVTGWAVAWDLPSGLWLGTHFMLSLMRTLDADTKPAGVNNKDIASSACGKWEAAGGGERRVVKKDEVGLFAAVCRHLNFHVGCAMPSAERVAHHGVAVLISALLGADVMQSDIWCIVVRYLRSHSLAARYFLTNTARLLVSALAGYQVELTFGDPAVHGPAPPVSVVIRPEILGGDRQRSLAELDSDVRGHRASQQHGSGSDSAGAAGAGSSSVTGGGGAGASGASSRRGRTATVSDSDSDSDAGFARRRPGKRAVPSDFVVLNTADTSSDDDSSRRGRRVSSNSVCDSDDDSVSGGSTSLPARRPPAQDGDAGAPTSADGRSTRSSSVGSNSSAPATTGIRSGSGSSSPLGSDAGVAAGGPPSGTNRKSPSPPTYTSVLCLLQDGLLSLFRQGHAAQPPAAASTSGNAAAAATGTSNSVVVVVTVKGTVPVLHAYRHVCNKLYGAEQLPQAGRPGEVNEQAFAAMRSNAHAPEGINSGPGQWETLMHLLTRAHNIARMLGAPALLLRLLSSQYQRLPAYRAAEDAARAKAAAAGVDVSDDALAREATRLAVACHTRSSHAHVSLSARVNSAFAQQAQVAAVRHALEVAGAASVPLHLRTVYFFLAVGASPGASAVLRRSAAQLAGAVAAGVPYLDAVRQLVDALAKGSQPQVHAAATATADTMIRLLLCDLRDCQVRLADITSKEATATAFSDLYSANRRHALRRTVNEAQRLREQLLPLLPLSNDAAVRAFVPPAVATLATTPLPMRVGSIELAAGSAEVQAVLTARNKRLSAEVEITRLRADVDAAVRNTAALVAELEAQLDAATAAPQPDLVAAAGRSGLFLPAGDGVGATGDAKPLLFHTPAAAVSGRDANLFAHGLAGEVLTGLERMRGLQKQWERLQAGLALLPSHEGTTLAVQLDARGCGNFTRYGALLLRGRCLPATWARHVVGSATVTSVGVPSGAPIAGGGGAAGTGAGGAADGDVDDVYELAAAAGREDGAMEFEDDVDEKYDVDGEDAGSGRARDHDGDDAIFSDAFNDDDAGAGDSGTGEDGTDASDASGYGDDAASSADPLQALLALAADSGSAPAQEPVAAPASS